MKVILYRNERAQRREALRNRGYRDGVMGRPARITEIEYQQSYRRGLERRREIAES